MYKVTIPQLAGHQQHFRSISMARSYAQQMLLNHGDIETINIYLMHETLVDTIVQKQKVLDQEKTAVAKPQKE